MCRRENRAAIRLRGGAPRRFRRPRPDRLRARRAARQARPETRLLRAGGASTFSDANAR